MIRAETGYCPPPCICSARTDGQVAMEAVHRRDTVSALKEEAATAAAVPDESECAVMNAHSGAFLSAGCSPVGECLLAQFAVCNRER